MSAFEYSVFGLRVRSSLELPELFPASGSGQPDVTIEMAPVPDLGSRTADLQEVNGALVLTIPTVARYEVKAGTFITVDPEPNASDRNIRLFLLGSAFGALLHQRGLLPLHANAVEIDGRAFAFMGESGAGKSTLAATFHDQGHRIIADDVCVVGFVDKGQAFARPGLPRLRLWHDALASTNRSSDGYERSYTAATGPVDKFDVPIDPTAAASTNIPLARLYILGRGERLSVRPLVGVSAAEAVFRHTYRGSFVSAAGVQKHHWTMATQLIRSVPVYQVERPWDLHAIHDQMAALLKHAVTQSANLMSEQDG